MDFTREPIIETVITPKEGYKLAIRNSKGGGQEEFFVDAVEVISFGQTSFFRSLEKPKSFLVPVNDYEILETREPRIVLKTPAAAEKGIKIGGGREASVKVPKESPAAPEIEAVATTEQKVDKRRERRRYRKKRGGRVEGGEESQEALIPPPEGNEEKRVERPSLIPPPSTLISETIQRYKEAATPKPSEEEELPF